MNNNTNCTNRRILIADIRKDENYVLWYINIANFIVTCAVPFTALTYLNCRIYNKLKQHIYRKASRQTTQHKGDTAKELRQAIVLFVIVILFLTCHVPRVVLNIVEFVSLEERLQKTQHGCPPLRFWVLVAYPISHFLLKLNASVNFFVYAIFDARFRKVIRSKLDRQQKSSCLSNTTIVDGFNLGNEHLEMKALRE